MEAYKFSGFLSFEELEIPQGILGQPVTGPPRNKQSASSLSPRPSLCRDPALGRKVSCRFLLLICVCVCMCERVHKPVCVCVCESMWARVPGCYMSLEYMCMSVYLTVSICAWPVSTCV